jgi:hypothetical protein
MVIGCRHAEVGEERVRHGGIVMLTGVYQHCLVATGRQCGEDRGDLHEIGACPDHDQYLHRVLQRIVS